MSRTYKIGTRGSLLAVTQCTLIAQEMTKRTGALFELVKIKTQGDLQTDKPLWQMDGKDFFTKELDQALLNNDVDLVVHSYKDLGSDRPHGIELASITEREYANDILLVRKESLNQIRNISVFNVGTSSPRRIVNTEKYLKDFLPNASKELTVKCSMLRGNVNTRIRKLKDGDYDAIVLALAGLERLAQKEDSLKELETLLNNLTFMVMPQKVFPSSASQGALAIEFNGQRSDPDLYKVLRSVHCKKTENEVKNERALFKSYGGGCHLAVGINTQTHKDFLIDIERGIYDNNPIDKVTLHGVDYTDFKSLKTLLPIGDRDKLIKKNELSVNLEDHSAYFVTSKYCINAVKDLKHSFLFASGSRTMKRLVKSGHWVNGSADSLGHQEIQKLCSSQALKIMMSKDITVLSHNDATSELGKVIPCYKRVVQESSLELIKFQIDNAQAIYWSSFFQYQTYLKFFPQITKKVHFCGLGKTFDQFKNHGIDVSPFASMKQLKEITNIIE
jgi:hydroxymethylbilane synthase